MSGFDKLTRGQRIALAETLLKHDRENGYEEGLVPDSDLDVWSKWATGNSLSQHLENLGIYYKNTGDKAAYFQGLDVLRIFYPEVDSPLFNAMREDE